MEYYSTVKGVDCWHCYNRDASQRIIPNWVIQTKDTHWMILFISDITKDELINNDRSGLVVVGRVVRGIGEQDYQEAELSDMTKCSSSVLTVVHTCQNQPGYTTSVS